MRTLFIVLLLLAVAGCSKAEKDNNASKSTEVNKKPAGVDILFIGSTGYTKEDLSDYVDKNYSYDTEEREISSTLKSKFLDLFIAGELIAAKAQKSGVNITESDIDDYAARFSNKKLSRDDMKKTLMVQKYLSDYVYNNISVTDKEIQKYYSDHRDEFRKKKEVLLYQILLKDKEVAQKIRTELVNYPSRFEEYAASRSHSIDASKNGLMGYYEEGTLPSEMEQVVFSMRKGEISPVVSTPYGYHIFLVKKKKSARTLYLSKVSEKIRKKLMAVKIKSVYSQFYSNLFKESGVRIVYDKLDFEYKSKGELN